MPSEPRQESAAPLLEELAALRRDVLAEGDRRAAAWGPVERRAFRLSCRNLAQYLALRRRDLRSLQARLMALGLSSLGRLEGRVQPTLDATCVALAALAGCAPPDGCRAPGYRRYFRGARELAANTDQLFGPSANGRPGRILVTLPTEAAGDPALLDRLVGHGADAVRINCAHDTPDLWAAMIANVRRAEAAHGRRVRILMDLGGPKLRTGPVAMPGDGRRLQVGDELLLTADPGSGAAAAWPYRAGVEPPEVLDRIAAGHRVWLDDGKLGGEAQRRDAGGIVVRIAHAAPEGYKLKPEKGVNLPDSSLGLAALSPEDLAALDFVALQADMIGYSFVQSPDDIALLQRELAARRPHDWQRLGLIAKIETPQAVAALPGIIVAAARRQPFGIMIARGDLAVEIGFERLAEMQEEILWLAEAARVPAIWATQVLEHLVKKGIPTRGEMTDAAMAARAECVMLNKGPNVVEAVAALNRLLRRMGEHQTKKTPQMRALKSWTEA